MYAAVYSEWTTIGMELQEPLWYVRIVQISKVMAVEGTKGEGGLVPVL
jgi:hypothetical protein